MEFDKMDFQSISNLIFAGYTGGKNSARNRLKIKFMELDFTKIKYKSIGMSAKQM